MHVLVLDSTTYVSSLPVNARPHLELQLDHDNGGVDKDLYEIAEHMLGWEEKLHTHLGLTRVNVHDIIKANTTNPLLQR